MPFMLGPRPESEKKLESSPPAAASSPVRTGPSLVPLSPSEKQADPSTLPPVPLLPSGKVPVIFALLGLAGGVVFGILKYLPMDRLTSILANIAGAILIPFGPGAWLAGLRYENRCIHLGFKPASVGRTGRILGAVITFLLALGGSALAVLEAVRRITAGK
jgi:hypothetical protein